MKRIFFSFICLTIGLTSTNAQCSLQNGKWISINGGKCVNTITTAVPFLRITPDARSGAMGDAGIAISPDANAMHFNASKLAFAEKKVGISANYTPWLRGLDSGNIFHSYLSGFYKIDRLQTIGLSVKYFSLGTIQFTDEQGNPTIVGNPNEFDISLAYSRQLIPKRLAVGFTFKYIYSNLAAGQIVGGESVSAGTTGAADISFTYKTPLKSKNNKSELILGLAFSNLGPGITYSQSLNKDYIPANLGIGGAWTWKINEQSKLTLAADINKLLVPTPCLGNDCDLDQNAIPDYKEQAVIRSIFSSFGDAPNGFSEELDELMYSTGMEFWYSHFAIRAGYYGEAANKGNRKYFTLGLGAKYSIVGLNLSYLVPGGKQQHPLDNTFRFSLLFNFLDFETDAG